MKLKSSSPATLLSNWLTKKIVSYTIRRERRQQSSENFSLSKLWHRLYANPLFRIASARTLNSFNLRSHDFVMFYCVRTLRMKKIIAAPEFFWGTPETAQRILDNPQSVLIVTLHNGFAFTMRAFAEAGRQVTTIARKQEEIRQTIFSNTKLTSPVTVITKDRYCLGRLRESVLKHHILCCAVDLLDNSTNRFRHISPALFAFASRLDLPLYYADISITPAGQATCSLIGPLAGNAEERLDAFLKHIQLTRPHAAYQILPHAADQP